MKQVGDDGENKNKNELRCRFGIVYKNSTIPRILFELGCQHKHTETGGAWSVAHKLPLLSTTRPTGRLNGGWCPG